MGGDDEDDEGGMETTAGIAATIGEGRAEGGGTPPKATADAPGKMAGGDGNGDVEEVDAADAAEDGAASAASRDS